MEGRELILIGTVHRDPDGMGLLLQLLRREGPVRVTVEVSPYGLFFRKRRGRRLIRLLARRSNRVGRERGSPITRWGQVQAISAQFSFPFEYRASLRYCRDRGAGLSCLDVSSHSLQWIQEGWEDLVSISNLRALCRQDPQGLRSGTASAYTLASRLMRAKEDARWFASVQGWPADADWQRREAFLAEGLKREWATVERGRLAHVGGWQHLLRGTASGTLYERVAHLHPRTILLADSG